MNNSENQYIINCIIEELEQLKTSVKELEEIVKGTRIT